MDFYKEIVKLQEENKGCICLIKMGNFYTAIGKDALCLSESLTLKRICFKKEVCKIGILREKFSKVSFENSTVGV